MIAVTNAVALFSATAFCFALSAAFDAARKRIQGTMLNSASRVS
jgi:hypothetical protein